MPTAAEATKLFALAKKQKKILSVFQNRRYDADYLTLKKLLASGQVDSCRSTAAVADCNSSVP